MISNGGKYWVSSYEASGTILGTEDMKENKVILSLKEFTF